MDGVKVMVGKSLCNKGGVGGRESEDGREEVDSEKAGEEEGRAEERSARAS